MAITAIEKAAKLTGRRYSTDRQCTYVYDKDLDEHIYTPFNPYTNKADLMDVECALGIDVEWNDGADCVHAVKRTKNLDEYKYEFFSNHPNKLTARAHAVMAVVEQIYDRTNP